MSFTISSLCLPKKFTDENKRNVHGFLLKTCAPFFNSRINFDKHVEININTWHFSSAWSTWVYRGKKSFRCLNDDHITSIRIQDNFIETPLVLKEGRHFDVSRTCNDNNLIWKMIKKLKIEDWLLINFQLSKRNKNWLKFEWTFSYTDGLSLGTCQWCVPVNFHFK